MKGVAYKIFRKYISTCYDFTFPCMKSQLILFTGFGFPVTYFCFRHFESVSYTTCHDLAILSMFVALNIFFSSVIISNVSFSDASMSQYIYLYNNNCRRFILYRWMCLFPNRQSDKVLSHIIVCNICQIISHITTVRKA